MNPNEWILSMDTGTSSKTIWAVMMGVVKEKRQCDDMNYDVPHDPSDFERCWKLLVQIPEWKARLQEVADIFPKWIPFIREWKKLTEMYYQWRIDINNYEQLLPKDRIKFKFHGMYDFMQELEHEGMLLDGWMCKGKGSYERIK